MVFGVPTFFVLSPNLRLVRIHAAAEKDKVGHIWKLYQALAPDEQVSALFQMEGRALILRGVVASKVTGAYYQSTL